MALCEQTPGSLPRILGRILVLENRDRKTLEEECQLQLDRELPAWERYLGSLALIAKLLPLLGFLGTTVALMAAFLGDGGLLAYPSTALFEKNFITAFSLAIGGIGGGILMNLSYHILHGQLRRQMGELELELRQFVGGLVEAGKVPHEKIP
jgi:biopolymer transport protein ExbB/TolQ